MYTNIKSKELDMQNVFNIAFSIFTNNFKFMLILGLLIYIPVGILFLFMPQITTVINNSLSLTQQAYIGLTLASMVSMVLIYTVFVQLVYAAITSFITEIINSNEPSLNSMFKGIYKKLGKHIYTTIMYNLIIAPMMLLIIPGVYFSVSLIFYPCFIAITDKWGFGALAESKKIVKGRWFKTFSFLGLTLLFSIMIRNFLGAIPNMFPINVLNTPIFILSYFVFAEIIGIYFRVVVVVWFLNRYYLLENK